MGSISYRNLFFDLASLLFFGFIFGDIFCKKITHKLVLGYDQEASGIH